MLLGLFVLVTRWDFGADILLPGIAGAFVFALILNSLLGHFGYRLW